MHHSLLEFSLLLETEFLVKRDIVLQHVAVMTRHIGDARHFFLRSMMSDNAEDQQRDGCHTAGNQYIDDGFQ
jgi:hypothetical protein